MNMRLSTCLLPALALLLAVPCPSQDEKKEPDPEVQVKLDELEAALKDRKFEKDAEGIAAIDALLQKLQAGMHEKDQKAVLKGLRSVLTPGKLRPPDNIGLYRSAAVVLGYMGSDGAKVLWATYKAKKFPDKDEWVPLREILLVNLGKTVDAGMVDLLCKEARRAHQAALMAAAGEALGNYRDAEFKVRHEIVDQLLIRYGEVDAKARAGNIDPGNLESQNARDRLATIEDKWNTTLSALTRQNLRSYPDWQKWWNDNKKNQEAWK